MTDNSNLTNQIIELKELIEQQQTTLDNREAFIDWVMENHPVVIKQYLGWGARMTQYDKLVAFVYLLYAEDEETFNKAYKLITGRSGKFTFGLINGKCGKQNL